MIQKRLVSIFVQLGLSGHEALVYVAALGLGPATVIDLSDKSGVKRTTVYTVVESLLEKGLMNVEVKGLKRRFVAEHPSKLEAVLESRKDLLHSALVQYESAFTKRGAQGGIRYYQGLAGMRTAYTELLNSLKPRDFYYALSDHGQWYGLDPQFFQSYFKRRAKMRIQAQVLLVQSDAGHRMKKFDRNFSETVKMLPTSTKLSTNTIVTPHRVMVHQLTRPVMVIVIENQSVIQSHKQTFELLWDSLEN